MTNSLRLADLFKYYRHGTPHQMAAISELEAELLKQAPDLLNREQPWFKTWSQGGQQVDLAAAIKLIKQFEGCHLEAYPDPLSGGEPWTIGYGTTRYRDGRKVSSGDKINAIEADELLQDEVVSIAYKLRAAVPFWQAMADHQQCVLISFAYNLGSGFYGAAGFETISRCLRDKDWGKVPEALLLYRNPGTNVEAGLKRRRIAEGTLWNAGAQPPAPAQARLTPSSPFTFKVTPNISYGELCNGEQRRRFTVQGQCEIATELCRFLEKVRNQFGKPIIITSGHRPPAINAEIGGASNSEHLYKPGCGAVDFYVDGVDIYKVQQWCDKEWPYSIGYGAPKGFVHLGIRDGRPRVRWVY